MNVDCFLILSVRRLCGYKYHTIAFSPRTSLHTITRSGRCQGLWTSGDRHGLDVLFPLLSSQIDIGRMQVCVNYKDKDYLIDECEDGRRLGFDGKVCEHRQRLLSLPTHFSCTPCFSKQFIQLKQRRFSRHSLRVKKVCDTSHFTR